MYEHRTEKKDAAQTIQDRLDQMETDLIALAHCCNRDRQYDEATKVQGVLSLLGEVNIQCADVAVWPPKVNVGSDGTSVWEVVE